MIENLYDCVILELPRRFMNFLYNQEEEKGKVTDLETSEGDCVLEKATGTRESTSLKFSGKLILNTL